MSETQPLNPDYFLVTLAQQLADNYQGLRAFRGGRVYFKITEGETTEYRTLLMDADKPRVFRGAERPKDESEPPYLHIALTVAQLAQLFTGKFDPAVFESEGVVFEGNNEAFYRAIGEAL